jgi:hypothetical protein
MVVSIKNKWLAISLLAIIFPTALLVSLKFSGILKEPQKPETVILEPIIYQIERPLEHTLFDLRIKNNYSDSAVSMNVSLVIFDYYEMGIIDWNHFVFLLSFNLTIKIGYPLSVKFTYEPSSENSTVFVDTNYWALQYSNMTIEEVSSWRTGEASYVMARALDSSCHLSSQCYWAFRYDDSQNHEVRMSVETMYFNGTAYIEVVCPIILQAWSDDGYNFETAKTIFPGTYYGTLNRHLNQADFFKINVEAGQVIGVLMTPKAYENEAVDCDLYLYDPDMKLRANSSIRGDLPQAESIIFTADSSGDWYVKVQYSSTYYSASWLYLLNITLFSSV